MADVTWTATIPDIEQGPAFVWYNTLAPADKKRMLINSVGGPKNPAATTWAATTAYSLSQEVWDGTNIEIAVVAGTSAGVAPTWPAVGATVVDGTVTWFNLGPPVPLGGIEGHCTIYMGNKLEDVRIDQELAPVDTLLIAEEAYAEFTIKESSLQKISYGYPNLIYSTGTDTGLPATLQAYEEIDMGGLAVPGIGYPGCYPAISVMSPRRGLANAGKFLVFTIYSAVPKDVYQVGIALNKEALMKVKFDGRAQLWRSQRYRLAQRYRQT